MTPELILHRIRTEYREMPGLRLTKRQACRLWSVDATTCETALARLLDEHFLSRTHDGSYVLFPGTRVCDRRRRRQHDTAVPYGHGAIDVAVSDLTLVGAVRAAGHGERS